MKAKVPSDVFKKTVKQFVSFINLVDKPKVLPMAVLIKDNKMVFFVSHDGIFIRKTFSDLEVEGEGYAMIDIVPLCSVAYPGKSVSLAFDKSSFVLSSGRFKANIGTLSKSLPSQNMPEVEINYLNFGLMHHVTKSCALPYAFVKEGKDKHTVEISVNGGKLVAFSDDSYSGCSFSRESPDSPDFKIQVLHSILSKMFPTESEETVQMGTGGNGVYLSVSGFEVFFPQVAERIENFDVIISERLKDPPDTYFEFVSNEAVGTLKPIYSMLDDKDQLQSIIEISALQGDQVIFKVPHSKLGSSENILECSDSHMGIPDNKNRVERIKINCHPRGLMMYLQLLRPKTHVRFFGYKDSVVLDAGETKYIFPTVQL